MKPSLLSKLDQLSQRLEEVGTLMNQENATADMDQYRKLTREHAELEPVVALHTAWNDAQADIRARHDERPGDERVCTRRIRGGALAGRTT